MCEGKKRTKRVGAQWETARGGAGSSLCLSVLVSQMWTEFIVNHPSVSQAASNGREPLAPLAWQ